MYFRSFFGGVSKLDYTVLFGRMYKVIYSQWPNKVRLADPIQDTLAKVINIPS